ncbi:hypothetical protein ACHBHL_03715 [Streptococcus sp. A27]|uniref:hypothetical protein n=1 Tax=unclassified Streptococcus TaxID=2608887 RepID=UPI00155574BB|nr:hypothetical protein [Streptococcus suis]NQP64797.1 hypothetical protein [Streptococcus suis]
MLWGGYDSQAWESLLGSPVAGARRGLSPQMYDMPVVLKTSWHKTNLFMIMG